MQAPAELPGTTGTFVRIDIEAVDPVHSSWAVPARAYMRRTADAWKLVGLERVTEKAP